MRARLFAFFALVTVAGLVACHGGSDSLPVSQPLPSNGHTRSALDVTEDNPTVCAEISTPSPGGWPNYTCYLKPNANTPLTDIETVASSGAPSNYTCSAGTWTISIQQTGVPLPSPDVEVSPTTTGDGNSSCSRLDQVTVTIKTGATPLPNFDPVYVTAHENLTVCDSINSSSATNTGGQIKLSQGLHIQDHESSLNYIEGQTSVHLAGQMTDLSAIAPEHEYGAGCTWSMPAYYSNDALSAYVHDDHPPSASPIPPSPSPLATDEVTWYNDRGENPDEVVLNCEVLPNGSSSPITLEAAADVGFETPTPKITTAYNAVFVSTNYISSACQPFPSPETVLTMGLPCPTASPGPGITWHYSINANDQNEQAGSIGLWQIVRSYYQNQIINGTPNPSSTGNCGDGYIPYYSGLPGMNDGVQSWNATWTDADAPAGAALSNQGSYTELDDSFDDYLMYRPAAEPYYKNRPSIWISLGHFYWSFKSNSRGTNGTWSTPTVTYATPGPFPALDTATPAPSFPATC